MPAGLTPRSAERVGLVLGGGGVAGMAFHAGVLLSLHHDLGWDARTADVVVGTSAGSIVGSLLRADTSPEDLAAWASGATPTPAGRKFRALMQHADQLPPMARVPRPTLPGWIALGTFAHPTQMRAALTSLLPHGLSDQGPQLAIIDRMLDRWPAKPLWISAVRVGDGRLTWFGRTEHDDPHTGPDMRNDSLGCPEAVRPADAVAASCAIPVLARPVRIGRHRYVDGGVHSPTNADALAGQGLDLVIVLSPMGATSADGPRSPSRRLAHRRLQHEIRILEERGTRVQVIGPDAATIKAIGWNVLDRGNTAGVMRSAFLGTSQQLRPDMIDTLGGRGTSRDRLTSAPPR